MYKHVMVPLDGSPFSSRAIATAAALARRTGAKLHLAIVYDPSAHIPMMHGDGSVPVFDEKVLDQQCAHDRAYVRKIASELTATGIDATGEMLEGTIVEALAEHAVAVEADLVVMTTHGRSGLNRLWLGSIANAFLSRSPAPVFLVRPIGDEAPSAGEELPTGTLLVPLDGSDYSESVIPHAEQFAESVGMSVELMTVVVPHVMPMAPFGTENVLADGTDIAEQEAEARARLQRVVRKKIPGATIVVVADMVPARAILEAAQQRRPGAIALATHGRTGIARLVLGSVADKVLRGAEQPLLVFHPDSDSK